MHADSGKWFAKRGDQFFFVKGKYSGVPLAQVAGEHSDYLDWMLGTEDMPEDTKAIVGKGLRRVRRS